MSLRGKHKTTFKLCLYFITFTLYINVIRVKNTVWLNIWKHGQGIVPVYQACEYVVEPTARPQCCGLRVEVTLKYNATIDTIVSVFNVALAAQAQFD